MASHRFAVIGNPIEHSLSPVIHQYFAQQVPINLTYEKIKGYETTFDQQVSDFFASSGKGLNVTVPFKQRAYDLATKTTPRCEQAQAANTLWMDQGHLWADNTDGIGLLRDLSRHISLPGKRILILGAGGAARGILNPLLEAQPTSLALANRSLQKAATLLVDFPQISCLDLRQLRAEYDLIINATSASLKGALIQIPEHCLSNKPFCYDLAYQMTKPTAFVAYAKSQGCEAIDGLGMLIEQAAEAFFIWNGFMPRTDSLNYQTLINKLP
ncbi:MAG: shikimate dehydrogenase [Legionellales bacterium]